MASVMACLTGALTSTRGSRKSEKFSVDWCKIKNIYMKDQGFGFD